MTTLRDFGGVLGRLWDTFLGSHNFMVTALGSCVKWPSHSSHLTLRDTMEFANLVKQLLKAHLRLGLPNNQIFNQKKTGKAFSVLVETPCLIS